MFINIQILFAAAAVVVALLVLYMNYSYFNFISQDLRCLLILAWAAKKKKNRELKKNIEEKKLKTFLAKLVNRRET